MLLSENSYIRNPPVILEPRQVLSFNGIRYCVDICELTYIRLIDNLISFTDKSGVEPLDFPLIYNDVWSLINNAALFGKIFNDCFDLERLGNRFNEINSAKELRDSNQHIEKRIDQLLLEKDLSVFGTLSWTKYYKDSGKCVTTTLYPGTFTRKKEKAQVIISNTTQIEFNDYIHKIELSSVFRYKEDKELKYGVKRIYLSRLINEIMELLKQTDSSIESQIGKVEDRHPSDLKLQLIGQVVK